MMQNWELNLMGEFINKETKTNTTERGQKILLKDMTSESFVFGTKKYLMIFQMS